MEARQLPIRLVNGETLSADESVLRACSSAARGLPADADVWDLSNLLIAGEPVQRKPVISWLNMCYNAVHGEPFVADGGPPDVVMDLFRLLAFADSIGATGGSVKPCITERVLLDLAMEVTVSSQQQQQQMEEDSYEFSMPLSWSNYCWIKVIKAAGTLYELSAADPPRAVSAAAKDAVVAQVAAQAEQLLYIAYKLQLQELVQVLKDFLIAATRKEYGKDPLLTKDMLADVVYSQRVLEAAGYSEAAGRAAWVRNQLHTPLLHGPGALLDYAYMSDDYNGIDVIHFPAFLQRRYYGQRRGTDVSVAINVEEHTVQLDFGGEWGQQVGFEMVALNHA